jgi:hypothetical protein
VTSTFSLVASVDYPAAKINLANGLAEAELFVPSLPKGRTRTRVEIFSEKIFSRSMPTASRASSWVLLQNRGE